MPSNQIRPLLTTVVFGTCQVYSIFYYSQFIVIENVGERESDSERYLSIASIIEISSLREWMPSLE